MAATVKVERINGAWVCHLQGVGGVELYRGSANAAQDMAESVDIALADESQIATVRRIDIKGKKCWVTEFGGMVIRNFKSSANKADDLAQRINEVLGWAARTEDFVPGPDTE